MSLLDDMPQKWLDFAITRTGINLPNCFTWSTARISWLVGMNQPLDPVNKRVLGAQDLWNTHHENFVQSQTPRKGALMIWKSGQWGHVANVESVNANGTITWTQSNYGGNLFEVITGNPKGYCGMQFLGYLVHKKLLPQTKVEYKVHIQGSGWSGSVADGTTAGTTGKSKRIEAIQVTKLPCALKVKAHIQGIGTKDYGSINTNTIIGTTGQSKRLEAIYLEGRVYAQVHIQGSGWSAKSDCTDGMWFGTKGMSKRIEAIRLWSK